MLQTPHDLLPDLRQSLRAKIDRLLRQPLIGAVVGTRTLPASPTEVPSAWTQNDDGTCRVCVAFPETPGVPVEQVLKTTLETPVTLLDDELAALLRDAPRSFLDVRPAPQTVELLAVERDVERSTFVLTLAAPPTDPARVGHVAVVPNLVPLQRQLDALSVIAKAPEDGPLAPLRALVGLGELARDAAPVCATEEGTCDAASVGDTHQRGAIERALATPHFAVIQGPPGSGKTTVIRQVIERTVARGGRVLVVSPTHVAVDNVVERLIDVHHEEKDTLAPPTLPLRFAARPTKLSDRARAYWVGPKRELRGAAVGRRVEARLRASVPFAARLFALERTEQAGRAPLSIALAAVAPVVCGTPIGLLSCDLVRDAAPGSFDLLIVDEVSKMLLPEFLAIAIKAKRWLLVGDPEQLPPFLDVEECAATLEDVMTPEVELLASVGAFLETRPAMRREERLLVVASHPERMLAAIRAQLTSAALRDPPSVGLASEPLGRLDVRVAGPEVLDEATCGASSRDDGTRTLIERGLSGSAARLVASNERAGALLFEYAARIYHTQPWALRAWQRVGALGCKNGLRKLLPSHEALEALAQVENANGAGTLERAIATRYAVNAVSIYDWLVRGTSALDCSLLDHVASALDRPLRAAVKPHATVLRTQYRMHPSLSGVPRELFYGGEALLDHQHEPGCRVELVQVNATGDGEENPDEVERAIEIALRVHSEGGGRGEVLVITPYRAQEAALSQRMKRVGPPEGVEICTLDRCQGREADHVVISLVRSRATAFLESPKRWNVALTRAKRGLTIIGDLDAYRREAARARVDIMEGRAPRFGEQRPLMSVLARIVEAYDRQIAAAGGAS